MVVGVAVLMAACASPAETDEETVFLHVEVDIFSGRVNPAFDLEGAEAETFVVMLSDDIPAGTPATPPSVLGFRGFILTGDSLLGGDSVRSIRVVPDGYYVESTTGAISLIDDPGPYEALLPVVEDHLGPIPLPELPSPGST
jgi:hypothetical protein